MDSDLLSALSPEVRGLIEALIRQLLSTQNQTPQVQIDYRSHIVGWIDYILCRGLSPATVCKYKAIVNDLLRQFPQPNKVLLDTFLIIKHINGSGPSWLNMQIDALRSFFGYLTRQGLMSDDPSRGLERVKVPRRERHIPKGKDIATLLNHCEAKDKALVLLMVDCGLRVGEVCGIQLTDLDLEAYEVRVIGKGNKERRVPMSPITRDAIITYLKNRGRKSIYLFPHRHEERPTYVQSVDERLGDLCRKAGIPPLTAHLLRHFCASAMLEDGASLKVVSQILGHSTPTTTATIYWHILETDAKRQEHEKHNPLKRLEKVE